MVEAGKNVLPVNPNPETKLTWVKEFKERPYTYLYLKTGNDLEDIKEDLKLTPDPIQKGFFAAVCDLQEDPNLEMADVVDSIFRSNGLDSNKCQVEFWNVVRLLDRYMRRLRSILFVEWLKNKEGAFIVGDGWDFIDKSNAKAIFMPSVPANRVYDMCYNAKFVCNTNPYGTDIIHERVVFSFTAGTCVISDRNKWLDDNLGDIPALTLFDWNKDIEEQIASFVHDEAKAGEYADAAYYDIHKRYKGNPIKGIIEFAESVRTFAQGKI